MHAQLLEASKNGDVEAIKVQLHCLAVPCQQCLLLQQLLCSLEEPDQIELVNRRDPDGRQSTALHFAAGYNRLQVLQLLLDTGADVHARDKGWVRTW